MGESAEGRTDKGVTQRTQRHRGHRVGGDERYQEEIASVVPLLPVVFSVFSVSLCPLCSNFLLS
jgi:hypothetical protein